MLAFLIVSHHVPKINFNEYFFTSNELIYINNHEINKYVFNQHDLSYALSLLHKIKHINLNLNKAIEIINQHLKEQERASYKTLMQKGILVLNTEEKQQNEKQAQDNKIANLQDGQCQYSNPLVLSQ